MSPSEFREMPLPTQEWYYRNCLEAYVANTHGPCSASFDEVERQRKSLLWMYINGKISEERIRAIEKEVQECYRAACLALEFPWRKSRAKPRVVH